MWLQPLVRDMEREQLVGDYLEVDETPVRVLDPEVPDRCSAGLAVGGGGTGWRSDLFGSVLVGARSTRRRRWVILKAICNGTDHAKGSPVLLSARRSFHHQHGRQSVLSEALCTGTQPPG